MRVLIVGCGYVGQQVARRLSSESCQVFGWVASPDSARDVAEVGAIPMVGDAADPQAWSGCSRGWDAVVFTASTSGGGVEQYRRIHREALALALRASDGRPFIYTSSTSVYGQTDGSWVDEESVTEPVAATSRVLLEAEHEVLASGGVVLRLSGIYGPGRAVYLGKLMEGTAALADGGIRWVNQIHRDDAAAAIVWAVQTGRSREIFNVTDDEPVRLADLYHWLCVRTGLPFPSIAPGPAAGRRGLTNKRVSNARIGAAGWRPRHPTFREGYATLLGE
ncbi:MAG: SDR family oxidoreductase [Candidatus Methylacidiphilales bacterium]